jgi:hypothetical protein
MFISVADVKDAPVNLQVASSQIEQFLVNRKNKELAAAELQRLRSSAKIEYLNKSMMPDPKAAPTLPAGAAPSSAVANADPAAPAAPAAAPASETVPADNASGPDKAALDRGVAGLK